MIVICITTTIKQNNMYIKYSQGLEENYIVKYFKDFKGKLLDIGANDGKTFSNSLALIELGWSAVLVEPSPKAFVKLESLHKENSNVRLYNLAISKNSGVVRLHESESHLKDKSDIALLSSLNEDETTKWKNAGVDFKAVSVDAITYDQIKSNYDFITIDAEGYDLEILKQIDLTNTKLLCIEWNSIESNKEQILEYTSTFGMDNIIYQSAENLLICRKQ